MIEKTVTVNDKEVKFKSSATIPRLYRIKFKRDIFKDLAKLEKSFKVNEQSFEIEDLEIFENVAYIMAYHADKTIPPTIDEWLKNSNPNTRRSVIEGLRIWTSRPYFRENPTEAIRRISALKGDTSEYVRKSVGNALRDISKKFPDLIKEEVNNWELENKEIKQVYKLASKFIEV